MRQASCLKSLCLCPPPPSAHPHCLLLSFCLSPSLPLLPNESAHKAQGPHLQLMRLTSCITKVWYFNKWRILLQNSSITKVLYFNMWRIILQRYYLADMDLSKILHHRILGLKILHHQFHLISTVLVRKSTKKWVKMEKFTPLAKNLHCRRHWRQWQIPPLLSWISFWRESEWSSRKERKLVVSGWSG